VSRVLCAARRPGRRPGARADQGAPRQTAPAPPPPQSLQASAPDTPRVPQARVDDRARLAPLDRPRLPGLDASGLHLAMTRLDGPHVTLVGALGTHGITAVMTGAGATDAEGCGADGAPGRAHNVAGVPSAMAAQAAHVLDWPPSAPELSPLEPGWSTRKTDRRQANARPRETREIAMTDALATRSVSEARRWFQPCGDALQ
jgi:hypothetical protein